MSVLFDNNVLCLLLHPEADVPNDPATGKPIERAAERVRFLADTLHDEGTIIIIPTPVLAEFLTFAAPEYLTELTQSMWFELADFDQPAAIEAAIALRRDLQAGGAGKKLGMTDVSWQEVKVDRHIVAIGKARAVTAVYSTDKGLLTVARSCGIPAKHVADLPVPPDVQQQMTLDELLEATTSSETSSAPPKPASQSPGAESPTSTVPGPGLPSTPLAAPEPQQPDSSPHAAQPPPSEK